MEHETGAAARSGFAERIKEDSKQRLESSKRSAADHVREIAQAIERASEALHDTQPTLARYLSGMAGRVGNLAIRLREGSWDAVMEDARQLARRNPGLYLAGGVAFGFALSRFLKASSPRAPEAELPSESAVPPAGFATAEATRGTAAPSMQTEGH